jgi:predicted Holliday junction resolvase-like endonuclease
MTNLEIFIFSTFSILLFFLKRMYDKNDAAQALMEAFLHEIDNLSTINQAYSSRNNDLVAQLKQKEHDYEILIQKNNLLLNELESNIASLKHDLEKQAAIHATQLEKSIAEARKDSLKRSRSVIRGQASEHLAPYVIEGTNPKDYRFMGNPIDYICFDGLSDVLDGTQNELKSVRFVDIKTGKSNLNKSQRRIRDAISENKVTFEVINLDNEIEKQNDFTNEKLKSSSNTES